MAAAAAAAAWAPLGPRRCSVGGAASMRRSSSSSSSSSSGPARSARPLTTQVGDQAGEPGDQHVVAGHLGRATKRGERPAARGRRSPAVIDVIEPTLRERPLEPAEPVDVLVVSKMKSRNTISRNMPPKAAIVGWASFEVLRVERPARSSARSSDVGDRPSPAATATITSGNTSRMPKTAIRMPRSGRSSARTGAHPLEDVRVDDGVVERERDLEDRAAARRSAPTSGRRG